MPPKAAKSRSKSAGKNKGKGLSLEQVQQIYDRLVEEDADARSLLEREEQLEALEAQLDFYKSLVTPGDDGEVLYVPRHLIESVQYNFSANCIKNGSMMVAANVRLDTLAKNNIALQEELAVLRYDARRNSRHWSDELICIQNHVNERLDALINVLSSTNINNDSIVQDCVENFKVALEEDAVKAVKFSQQCKDEAARILEAQKKLQMDVSTVLPLENQVCDYYEKNKDSSFCFGYNKIAALCSANNNFSSEESQNDNGVSMHSRIPARIRRKLTSLEKEDLMLILDTLSFDDSVLEYILRRYPPPPKTLTL